MAYVGSSVKESKMGGSGREHRWAYLVQVTEPLCIEGEIDVNTRRPWIPQLGTL